MMHINLHGSVSMAKNRFLSLLFLIIVVLTVSSCSLFTETNQVEKPRFNLPGGIYEEMQLITMDSSTLGATIVYTLDGSEPNSASPRYSDPIMISQTTTIKAKAFKSGMWDSKTAIATYRLSYDYSKMVHVSGGTFHNGTSDVTVSSFYIGKYQVTQAQYQAVMGTNPSYFINPYYPVERVPWGLAIKFCNRLSLQEGLTPCYSYLDYGTDTENWPWGWRTSSNVSCDWSADGYRLPTEMEWMFAAKGGNQSQGHTYSGSNDVDAVAWYRNNSGNETHRVGTKLPNELGIYDMSGNVWELCWDIWGYYPSAPQINPHGANSGDCRVIRGGVFHFGASSCTVSERDNDSVNNSEYDDYTLFTGIRLCRISP